ncbi:MAG: HEAT repeat domain-containing protein [candidate division WOR-3 bacterium]
MLIDQKPLTSNTVLGRISGNRDLIDEDLFVDLALVKPKRSENPKHPETIDPEKGSHLYSWSPEQVEKRFAYQEFLQEVIRNRTERNIAIIGEPGAGKTTLLQKLAFWLLKETDDLVVWVSLAELGSQPLVDYLEQKWLKEALGLSRDEIKADWEKKFAGGAFWLLLDGLDEMSQTDLQGLNFRGWVTNAPIILTCRLNLWQASPIQLQNFQTYLTQPFQDAQMQEFIRRWFPGLVAAAEADQLARSLWSELQAAGKERIKDLCRNPLRLTLLCATWKGREGKLPDTAAKLYENFVNYIYQWKKKEFPVTSEERKQLNAALGKLAKRSLEEDGNRFRLGHQLVCAYLGEPGKNPLLDMALKLGWLNQLGGDADEPENLTYAFYHAAFQEYFAALTIEDGDYFLPQDHVDCPVEGKRYRVFAPQWQQVIFLWLGREDVKAEKKESFIRALIEFEDGCGKWNFQRVDKGFYAYQAYFLAAAGINEFKACSRADEIVRQLVKWGFGKFNTEEQEWQTFLDPIEQKARKAIPATIRQRAITELSAIIKNCPNEYIRTEAIETLEKIDPGNPEAIAGLLQVIRTTENEDTRRQAAASLGEIGQGNPEAIAGLLQVIRNTKDEDTRMRAIESLGGILTTREQYAGVVSALKDYLSGEVYQNDFKRFHECYKVIWNCAENLPYREFYQAWHCPPTTSVR